MKRSIPLLLCLCLALGGAYAQKASFAEYQSAFAAFADSMASSLDVNTTIGDIWSTSFVGSFPKFGVGIQTGATFVDQAATDKLFTALNVTEPDAFKNYGMPIPAAAATFKIGLPFIPLDIGLKAGYLPASAAESLKGLYGVAVQYKNVGISLRYAVLKESVLLPAVSVGVAANYLEGSLGTTLGASQTFTMPTSGNYVTYSSPTLDVGWVSKNIDVSAQVSKQILFITPYAGAGISFGSSTVTGTMNATETANTLTAAEKQELANEGYTLGNQGFSVTSTSAVPVWRLYGGFSLHFGVVLDCQAVYLPQLNNFAGSLGLRVQL